MGRPCVSRARQFTHSWHLKLLREGGGGALSATALSEASTGTDLPFLWCDSGFISLNEAHYFAGPSANDSRQLFILLVPKLSLQAQLKY